MPQPSPLFLQILLIIGLGFCLWLTFQFEKRRLYKAKRDGNLKPGSFDSINPPVFKYSIYFFSITGLYAICNDVFRVIETNSLAHFHTNLFFPIAFTIMFGISNRIRQKVINTNPSS